MKEGNVDKTKIKVYLQAHFIEKDKKAKRKWPMSRGKGNYHNNGARDSKYSSNTTFQKGESSCNRGSGSTNYKGDNNRGRGGRRNNDKTNVQSYNCQNLRHFVRECQANKNHPQETEAK